MIKLGVIGLGRRISGLIKSLTQLDPEFHVTGVVDPDESGARERLPEADRTTARFYPSLPALIRRGRPDALLIGTRCNLHARYAAAAATAGLPLFLEKPIATSLRQVRVLEHAWRDARAEVVVSFPLRVSHLCVEAKRRLDAGAVGRVEHLLGVNYVPYGKVYFEGWYRDYRITQGLFLQKATHDFDYLALLAGAPIVRVAAMMARGRVHRDSSLEPAGGDPEAAYYPHIGTPETGMNEDSSSALLEFANGAKGVYTQVFYTRNSAATRGATISGLKGTLRFDWYGNDLRVVPHAEDTQPEIYRPAAGLEHFGGDAVLLANFRDVVRGKASSVSPLRAGLQSVHACLAAKRSAETGRFVDVPQITDL
ncbi:MAG: Gfo/Idh/MocA family oxidoreductase [Cephaloticoccus sp.]|nr:Gfo/Idh/MocA family oxidoreductase [Cephaloticoccus sp.]MCF7759556.1 Gfo/Idh/MocA family oxidoreductase [Cephaloticoccus sp.]